MARVNNLLVSGLALVLIAAIGNCLEFSYDYLYRPGAAAFALDYFEQLELGDAKSPEEVLAALKAFKGALKYERFRGDIQFWLELAEPDGDCGEDLAERFLGLYEGLKMSTKVRQKQHLLDHLAHLGGQRFERCASKALEEIERVKKNEQVVGAERFFRRAVHLDENASERDVYRKLRALSVHDADWNVDSLLSEAQGHDANKHGNKENVRDKCHSLFVENCGAIRTYLAHPLAMINMAKSLKPDGDYFRGDPSLGKLNEIRRICMDLRRRKYDFYQNLSRQLDQERGVFNSIRRKLGIQQDRN